jgi:uncharacterized protein YyaL (SSP411 family)
VTAALELQCDAACVGEALGKARAVLLEARKQRPAPRLDDKVRMRKLLTKCNAAVNRTTTNCVMIHEQD